MHFELDLFSNEAGVRGALIATPWGNLTLTINRSHLVKVCIVCAQVHSKCTCKTPVLKSTEEFSSFLEETEEDLLEHIAWADEEDE